MYDGQEIRVFMQMVQAVADHSEGFSDVLGDIFMEYISHGHNGQFFTPQHVSDLMAEVTCGGIRPGQSVYDLTCVKMTTINMLMNSIPGEVAWMNTLTMEHWRSYRTGLVRIGNVWLPTLKVLGAGETDFVGRVKETVKRSGHTAGAQLQLSFDF